jgi:prepilin signal peptidase PulO-like enzyme (type II secretory pathway)
MCGYTLFMIATALSYGLLGLIVGSFLNVLIIRHGARSLGGRSACMACGAQLQWFDMIPVFSWIILKGTCRQCHARISLQYPLVEATTALLFALIGYAVPLSAYSETAPLVLVYLAIAAFLVAIAVYDIRHTIIPDPWVYAFAILAGIAAVLYTSPDTSAEWMWLLLAGPIAASPLFALWLFSRGQWMGLGDAKLALGIGWLLGPTLGIVAIISVGILLPLPYLIRFFRISSMDKMPGGFTMRSEIPFGPFLIFSCIIIWFSLLYDVDLSGSFGPLLLLSSLS